MRTHQQNAAEAALVRFVDEHFDQLATALLNTADFWDDIEVKTPRTVEQAKTWRRLHADFRERYDALGELETD